MAVIKCKMCGGELVLVEGQSVAECEYCGSRQTVPTADNEKKLTLFARANRLRFACEFDKAAGIYESIVADFPEEAEAYWGLVLCKYGIEYVDDPATGKKIPTCHRSSFDAVLKDSNFDLVMEYADAASRSVYRAEAKAIEALRTGILEVSGKESPYDIFICYKETGADGGRTVDSVLAQELYDALTEKGYRVFFARITLEDKLGQEYEPYIFAALNSAKIMLAVGTEYDHYHAVWVKNEWSRYLSLIAKGEKKILIPCYKDIDPYDMPEAFSKLQGQDLGKIGAMQDLLRSIDKLLGKGAYAQPQQTQTVIQTSGPTADSLIKRARLYLEEENWAKVLEYCDQILDANPESAETYWIQELAQRKCVNEDGLVQYYYLNTTKESRAMSYARRFADEKMKQVLSRFDTGLQKLKNAENSGSTIQKLEKARARAKLLEGRVYMDVSCIAALGENDKLVLRAGSYKPECAHALQEETENWPTLASIKSSNSHRIIGIDYDGRLHFSKEREEYNQIAEEDINAMSQWTGIKSLYPGSLGWYGVAWDGSVSFVRKRYNRGADFGQGNVSLLQNVERIFNPEADRVIFLKKDGTLAATRYTGKRVDESQWDEMSGWTDIVDLVWITGRVVGLKKDGSLVATSFQGVNPGKDDKWPEISKWKDIVKIFWGCNKLRICALDRSGKLLATSPYPVDKDDEKRYTYDPWRKVSNWKGLVSYEEGNGFALGLRANGTVVSAKWFKEIEEDFYDDGQVELASRWKDVVYLNVRYLDAFAVRRDGSVLTTDDYEDNGHVVPDMKLFDGMEALEKRLEAAAEIIKKEAEKAAERRQKELELQRKDAAYGVYKTIMEEKIEKERKEKGAPIREKYRKKAEPIREEMEKALAEHRNEKKHLQNEITFKEQKIEGLGFFKRKEKETLTRELEALNSRLRAVKEESAILKPYQVKLNTLTTMEQTELTNLSREIREAYPIVSYEEFQVDAEIEAAMQAREEAAKPVVKVAKPGQWRDAAKRYYANNWEHFTRDLQPMLECMERMGQATVNEMVANHPRKNQLSLQTATGFLREEGMKHLYELERTEGKVYFSISPDL